MQPLKAALTEAFFLKPTKIKLALCDQYFFFLNLIIALFGDFKSEMKT